MGSKVESLGPRDRSQLGSYIIQELATGRRLSREQVRGEAEELLGLELDEASFDAFILMHGYEYTPSTADLSDSTEVSGRDLTRVRKAHQRARSDLATLARSDIAHEGQIQAILAFLRKHFPEFEIGPCPNSHMRVRNSVDRISSGSRKPGEDE
jgi:hypothetical protein